MVLCLFVDREKKIFADSLTMLIWKVLTVVVSTITAVLLARWLGPDLRGELAIIILTLSLVTLVFQLGFPEAAIYILGSDEHQSRASEIVIIGIGFILSLLFIFLTLLINVVVSPIKEALYVLLSATGGASILVTFVRHIFLAKKYFHVYSITIAIEVVVYLGSLLALNFYGELTIFRVVMSYFLSLSCALLASFFLLDLNFLKYYKEPLEVREILGMCISKGKHFFIVGLGGFGTQRLNYFLLEQLSGIRSVGLFSAASTLPSFFGMIPQQVATVAYSHVANAGNKTSPLRLVRPIIQALFLLVVAVVVALSFYADVLVVIVFGPEFSTIGDPMLILCLAAGLSGISSICVNALSGAGRPQVGSYMTLLSLICILVFGGILIPVYGLLGAALSLLVASFLTLSFTMLSISRVSDESILEFFKIR